MPKWKPQPRRPSKTDSSSVRARARKAPPVPATAVAPTPAGFGAVGLAEADVDLQAEDLARRSLCEVLDLLNHTAMVAYSGDEGLEKSRALRPDVVLCDIGLPGMDGHEVARAIRADATLSATTLVALTGYASPEDLAKSQEAGFDFHLAKPPSIEAIEQVLAQAMHRAGNPQLQELRTCGHRLA